jgi:RNA-dependent RNA polymerase
MNAEPLVGNRVLRHFGAEHALRVEFRDDHLGKFDRKDVITALAGRHAYDERAWRNDEEVPARKQLFEDKILALMKQTGGLSIGLRRYRFLAWSSSQMRDNGIYMYADHTRPGNESDAPDIQVTVDSIREWIGLSADCGMSVSKYMSRIGMCFTQGQATIDLCEDDYVVESDIEGGMDCNGDAYVFSDGCGRASLETVKAICDVHIPVIQPLRSAYQIRALTGIKGMLSMDPFLGEVPPKTPNVKYKVCVHTSTY